MLWDLLAIIMKGEIANIVGFASYNYEGRNCECYRIC
jgi:hypothetical protein